MIITVIEHPEDLTAEAKDKGVELISFQELRDMGKENLKEFRYGNLLLKKWFHVVHVLLTVRYSD